MPPPPTHFLCIPLRSPQLRRTLASFKADVTSHSPAGGGPLPGQAIRPPSTLHLTLGVMSLRDEGAVARAVSILRSLRLGDVLDQLRAPPGFSFALRGLGSTRKASATTVLYAPPDDAHGILRSFCEHVRRVFQEAGLMEDSARPLLLHATVVNTIYVSGRGPRRGGRRPALEIDARDLMDRYEDYVWAEDVPLRTVAICRMGAREIPGGEEGDQAYEVEAEVGLDR